MNEISALLRKRSNLANELSNLNKVLEKELKKVKNKNPKRLFYQIIAIEIISDKSEGNKNYCAICSTLDRALSLIEKFPTVLKIKSLNGLEKKYKLSIESKSVIEISSDLFKDLDNPSRWRYPLKNEE